MTEKLIRWMLALFCVIQQATAVCPVIDDCVCNVRNSVELVVTCNSASVSNVTNQLRAEGVAANVTDLTFNGADDVTLASNTFSQFVSLTKLIINFAPLSQIDPGAFNNLTDLQSLDLRSNDLMWLSAKTFAGIGTFLQSLKLDRNQIQYLRSDLESFFSTIQTEITLDDNMLDCGCNIQWLAEFINANTSPEVRDAACSNGLSITDPSVNFSMCLDPCVQGFHSCHENATCSWNQSSGGVLCICNNGFVGDGFTCEQVCESTLNNCHANATCRWNGSTEDVICTCNPGFDGNGLTCSVPTPQTTVIPQTTLNSTATSQPIAQTTPYSTTTTVHIAETTPATSQTTPHSTTTSVREAETTPTETRSPETASIGELSAIVIGAILGIWIITTAVIAGIIAGILLYGRNKRLHRVRITPKDGESPPLIPMQFNEPEEKQDAVSLSSTHL